MSCRACPTHTPHGPHATRRAVRIVSLTGWMAPGAAFLLMPKCPACLAAYVAAATGLGVSLSAASSLRIATIVLCAAWVIIAAALLVRRFV